MKILLTGITGYVGKRILPLLLEQGHEVICCVRNLDRVEEKWINHPQVQLVEIDFLKTDRHHDFPHAIDVAFYLIHSMASTSGDFEELELQAARNFRHLISQSTARQVIYLGGISNDQYLSKHLRSRLNVEKELQKGTYALTALHAGIIIGSGSASFEIIRDMVEKLPVMITPKWVLTLSHPISIRDVLSFLIGVMNNEACFNKTFDIGGKDVLSYAEMLLQYAEIRKLKRRIVTLPIMTPRLSSYWLFFITSTSYKLAINLVNSLKVEVIAKDNSLAELLDIEPMTYREAVEAAFTKIRQNQVYSSWKDALSSTEFDPNYADQIDVPQYGCYWNKQSVVFTADPQKVLSVIWSIGGDNGWYYGTWLWQIRGYLDKLSGGIGLRRGRTNADEIMNGDALDFWRVLLADKHKKRLLLYAEMKLPGEAWLEFKIVESNNENRLIQTATYRPKGVWGRFYWGLSWPFHLFIFRGMARNIIKKASS
ncbi:SDR family oxidoreductase [Sunxiuqinia dokdonensis]|uniref:Epimerase n=1 Tax=Sunxiuqinia dokdonensis TaxID=1409788 RepID=A0A0L8VBE3_9BACT|nr:SDR family oxidoreductase [Sunxiuqinia dokdonensis]KOH45805.1 epimerase [Sunxiuqinia dokdonensis]